MNANDSFPQVVCAVCLPQIATACNIKETCINSDLTLRKDYEEEFPLPIPERTVKIESEPDIFNADSVNNTVKEEPLDDLAEFCNVDTPIDYDYLRFDPMRNVQYSPEQRSYSPERRRFKTPALSNRSKKEPPPSSFKCYLCKEFFSQRKLKYEHLESVHSSDEFKCKICKHKSQTARGMDNHIMLHENPGLLSHMCHVCSKNYQKACELRRHIKVKKILFNK